MVSATVPKSLPLTPSRACLTTPGPEIPTFMTHSGSPGPKNAPAMNGLSSGAFAKTTSFAHPKAPDSLVASAVFLMTNPMSRTASMLIPVLVEATLTDEHTSSVAASASGMDSIKTLSEFV